MKLQHKSFPMEVKNISNAGEFSGYLSVFGNVDSYREVVMPGAFLESLGEWAGKQKLPPILWQHNSREPIGPYTLMQEDEKGLYVEGRLLINDVQRAKEAYALMKNGVISGMSIGFETIGEEWDKENRLRKLTKIKLWEGSIVTFPANESAQIDSIKTVLNQGELPSLKEFEKLLREAGFSKTQAVAVTNKGLSHLLRSDSATDPAQEIIQAIKQFKI